MSTFSSSPTTNKQSKPDVTALSTLHPPTTAEIPPPPKHVPAHFKAIWATLPPCCRRFYLAPGQGCCSGQPQPNPGIMSAPSATTQATPANVTKRISMMRLPIIRQTIGTGRWMGYVAKGFCQDIEFIAQHCRLRNKENKELP
jgi:hypothetical protein